MRAVFTGLPEASPEELFRRELFSSRLCQPLLSQGMRRSFVECMKLVGEAWEGTEPGLQPGGASVTLYVLVVVAVIASLLRLGAAVASQMRLAKEQSLGAAATKLQAGARGWSARKERQALQEEKEAEPTWAKIILGSASPWASPSASRDGSRTATPKSLRVPATAVLATPPKATSPTKSLAGSRNGTPALTAVKLPPSVTQTGAPAAAGPAPVTEGQK